MNSNDVAVSSQEMSLKEIAHLLIKNWALFLILFLSFFAASILFYSFKVPYLSSVSILVNDPMNSALQSFTAIDTNGASKINEAKKSNSLQQKYLEFFKTGEFFNGVINRSFEVGQSDQITIEEKEGFALFSNDILGGKHQFNEADLSQIYSKLNEMLKIKISSDFQIEVTAYSMDKKLSLFLSNTVAQQILKSLTEKESKELADIEEFLIIEKTKVDAQLMSLNKQIAEFNSHPENLIFLSSKEKVADYISELMIRKNETLLKISENNKIIKTLQSASSGHRESSMYGNGGKVQALRLENDLLKAKLTELEISITRVTQNAKNYPLAAQGFEEIKRKSEVEFNKYKDINEKITKLQTVKLAAVHRFEILESGRFDRVRPFVSLTILGLLSIVLAQFVGSLIIYLRSIWDTNVVTASSIRNVVVVDGHSLDPKLIIENTKVKFRLARKNIYDDPENGENKKLNFSFSKSIADVDISSTHSDQATEQNLTNTPSGSGENDSPS